MSKNKLIEEGKNVEIDGGITVINENISLAEKAEEKAPEVAPVEQAAPVVEPVVAPVDQVAAPTVPVADPALASPVTSMPEVAPIPGFVAPATSVDPMATINPEFTSTVDPVTSFTPAYPPYTGDSTYANQVAADELAGKQTLFAPASRERSFVDTGVYKSDNDVDLAANKFIDTVRNAYNKNIANPTKMNVSLVNDLIKWGIAVTNNGLNRQLMEEFDELCKRYEGLKVATFEDESENTPSYDTDKQDVQGFGGFNGFGGMNY